ncbi:MAG: MOSC domain-containing protein [Gemmatimonadaceae bacterium]|nr:MOSC domain-containing protein [Gemmatimonadaceae bacterium]
MIGHPRVISVSRSSSHEFSKPVVPRIRLLAGLGVEGDAHAGVTVQHRSRVAQNPDQPNLRQVHVVHAELFEELAAKGFVIAPGDIGENITTRGIDLLSLPVDTELQLGATARVRITGLRNPCHQLNDFQDGLTKAVLEKRPDGSLIRKSGIMGVVLAGGEVTAGDAITVYLPPEPHRPLDRV